MKVLIIGGHGKVALLLSRELARRGTAVTSVIRNPGHAAEVEETGARALVLDIESAGAKELEPALQGHDAVVFTAGAGGGNPQRTYAVDRDAAIRIMDAAGSVGVRRFIMVSFSRAEAQYMVPEGDPFRPYQDAKIAADEHLRASGLDWTILGPGALTGEPATGTVTPDADPTAGALETSRGNVALVIAEALESPASVGKTLVFCNGDTPITQWLRPDAG